MPELNAKRERFCREYVIDLNATQAYIRAGYSKNGAGQSADKLLKNAEIATRIAELNGTAMQRLEITQDQILTDINDIAKEAREAGQFGAAIKGKELVGKHLGLWRDDTGRAQGLLTLLEEIARARLPMVTIEHEPGE